MILCWFFLGLKLSAAMTGFSLLGIFCLFDISMNEIFFKIIILFFTFAIFWQYEWYSLARHWANSLIICAYFCVFSWPMLRVNSFSNSHCFDSNLRHVYFWPKFWKVRIIFRGFFVSFSISAFLCVRFWLRGIDGCGRFKNVLISVRRRALHMYIKI